VSPLLPLGAREKLTDPFLFLPRTINNNNNNNKEFAFVLENLETQFYQEALKKFQPSDYISAGFESSDIVIEEITIIQGDEFVHVTAIQDIIVGFGQTPIQCQFDFSSVLTDVSTMVSFAQLVENVGVGAYLGAAHLIQEPRVLTAAASIVTIESRHQTVLNLFQGLSPIPQSFDIPLLPNEVLALAGPLIKGCDLGIQGAFFFLLDPPQRSCPKQLTIAPAANVGLTITNTEVVTVGTSLQFSSSAFSGMPSVSPTFAFRSFFLSSHTCVGVHPQGFFCQMLAGGLPFSIPLPMGQCVVPQGINGPVAIWITSDGQPLNGGAVDRQSNAIVAGPTMAFINSTPDSTSSLFRQASGNSSSSASSSSSTTTVTPPEATSMIISAMSVMASDMVNAIDSASSASATGSASATDSASATADASASATAGVVFSMVPMPSASP